MAKRAKKAGGKLGDFAEELGTFLGTTQRKATALLGQRDQVAARLSAIRDKADQLLRDLAGGAGDLAVAAGFAGGTRRKTVAKRAAPKSSTRKRKTARKAARKTSR